MYVCEYMHTVCNTQCTCTCHKGLSCTCIFCVSLCLYMRVLHTPRFPENACGIIILLIKSIHQRTYTDLT